MKRADWRELAFRLRARPEGLTTHDARRYWWQRGHLWRLTDRSLWHDRAYQRDRRAQGWARRFVRRHDRLPHGKHGRRHTARERRASIRRLRRVA